MGTQARAVGVGDPGRAERLARRPDLVAGGEDRDPRPPMDQDVRATGPGDERHGRGADRRPRREDGLAGPEVTACGTDRVTRRGRDVDEAGGGHGSRGVAASRTGSSRRVERRGVLDRHDRVRALREARPGGDPDRRARHDRDIRGGAGRDVADDPELHGRVLGGPGGVGAPDRIAVHRRIGPGRKGDARGHGLGGDPAERIGGRDAFRAHRLGDGQDGVTSGLEAEQPRGRGGGHRPGAGSDSEIRRGGGRGRDGPSRAAAGEPGHAQRDRDDHDPDHDGGLLPELEREELDEPVRRGSNRNEPGGKKTSWNASKSWSNATSAIAPRMTTPTVRPSAPPRTARHVALRSRRRLATSRTTTEAMARTHRAPEDGPDVGHVGPLALVEDGRAIDRDREVATEHEVGQDRVRGGPELGGGEAGPGRGLRALLLEGDPLRVRNGRIAMAMMTRAVARPIRIAAIRRRRVCTGQS